MKLHLKVKFLSLAEEARIIRQQETKLKRESRKIATKLDEAGLTQTQIDRLVARYEKRSVARESIYLHRVKDIRPEARATHIAYAFLRGVPYENVESLRYTDPKWDRVEEMVKKFAEGIDPRTSAQKFAEWKDSAGPVSKRVPKVKVRPSNKDDTNDDTEEVAASA